MTLLDSGFTDTFRYFYPDRGNILSSGHTDLKRERMQAGVLTIFSHQKPLIQDLSAPIFTQKFSAATIALLNL